MSSAGCAEEILRETRSPALPMSGSVGNPDHRTAWEEMGRSGMTIRGMERTRLALREPTRGSANPDLRPLTPPNAVSRLSQQDSQYDIQAPTDVIRKSALVIRRNITETRI